MLHGAANKSMYPLHYHITPEQGLLNDPNGLIYFKGNYHVFYQWNPYGTEHDNKAWGHVVSDDMVNWERKGIALAPSEYYDKDGVYSGSAIVKDDQLYLFYTGNVVEKDGVKHSYQCLAVSTDGLVFEKIGPLFPHPKGFTRHVRDPKVWYDDTQKKWYLVLGAQNNQNKGTAIFYSSFDFVEWEFLGELFASDQVSLLNQRGYMWECPDFFTLDDELFFTFSPQGIVAEGNNYRNIFQSVYVQVKQENGRLHLQHQELRELDWGFEFYAPQTFQAPDGRRILYGWIGVMEPQKEQSMPTIVEGWAHTLTIPRELTFEKGTLKQYPVKELQKLRQQKHPFSLMNEWRCLVPKEAAEVRLDFSSPAGAFRLNVKNTTELYYDNELQQLTLSRLNWLDGTMEKRTTTLSRPLVDVVLYLDGSSIEVFVNSGDSVASARFFEVGPFSVSYAGSNQGDATVYVLEGGTP